VSEERFYSRWARLKTEHGKAPDKSSRRAFAPVIEEMPAEPMPAPTPEDNTEPAPPLAKTPADQETPEPTRDGEETTPELPAVESLDYDSDYSGFMSEGVSDELRNLALRRLWRSNPVLANLDGLNDYDEDFTFTKTALGTVQSAYKALGGYGRREEEEEEVESVNQTAPPEEATAETGEEPALEDEESASEDGAAPDQAVPDDKLEKPLT
jgi:hypothetical protein